MRGFFPRRNKSIAVRVKFRCVSGTRDGFGEDLGASGFDGDVPFAVRDSGPMESESFDIIQLSVGRAERIAGVSIHDSELSVEIVLPLPSLQHALRP